MADIDTYVGPRTQGDGNQRGIRADREGSQVSADGAGHFEESSSRGVIYTCSTPVAGVAPGTALSTTPPVALWNPLGSGKLLVILKTTVGYVSGTLGAGSIVYAQVVNQGVAAPTTGNERTPVDTKLTGTRGVGRYFEGSTVAATPTILRAAYIMGAALATSVAFQSALSDSVDGEFVVSPGGVFVMQGVAAAGTSPLVLFGITWKERSV